MIKRVDVTLSRGVELGSKVPQSMLSSVEVSIIGRHNVGNVFMVVMPSTTVINEGVDFVSSPPVEGESLE